MTFAHPWWLLLLGVPALLVARWFWEARRTPSQRSGIAWSALSGFKDSGNDRSANLRLLLCHCGRALRIAAVVFLVLALARPQKTQTDTARRAEGIDIMMVVDTSGSMRAQDFVINNERPTRLEVVKSVIAQFIHERPDDRIGMVVFGTEAFTQAPLTLDHQVLNRFLAEVRVSMAGDATAIGDGLATAVKRLKDVTSKSRVVILLTDGSNTAGRIDPLAAAKAAEALGIRVYTIGVGSEGTAPMVIEGRTHMVPVEIDEKLLQEIAHTTGGNFYRATDTEALVAVYRTIDRLEKTRAEIKQFRQLDEKFAVFLWPAISCLFLEALFMLTPWRRVPA